MAEPTLFPVEPVPVALTERQQFVLDELRRYEDGLDADEVGAMLCERNGRHDRGTRCKFDASSGRSVLKALKKKGLIKRRGRGGTWVALEQGDDGRARTDSRVGASPSSSASSQEGPGELPDDF